MKEIYFQEKKKVKIIKQIEKNACRYLKKS